MALNMYLALKGQHQGDIHGSVTQKGRENSIAVHAMDHEVVSPRDPASGLPTGKRMHKPFTFVKELDRSSPLLWTALTTNENLTSCDFQFWSLSTVAGLPVAAEKQMYTVHLTNASIASIREFMVDNEDPALAKFPVREEISLTYQKISWTWTDGSLTSQDDWESPTA